MRHFITYTGAGVICSGLVALILLVRICCPKLNASVSRHHADGCSVKMICKGTNTSAGFQIPLLIVMKERERVVVHRKWRAPRHLEHQSQQFYKMYESLDVLPVARISVCLPLPLSPQRGKSHLIQYDNRTGSWFEKCSSHHSRDAHITRRETHNTLFASLSLRSASSSSVAN